MDPLSTDQALQILRDAPVAHLGLISEGRPYVTPMSFATDGRRILFRTQAGKKLQAIEQHPSVCIEVSRYDEETGDWVSVIVTGKATEPHDAETERLAVEGLLQKYSKALGSPFGRGGLQPLADLPHVIEVVIEEISGMSSGSGFAPRTRPGRL